MIDTYKARLIELQIAYKRWQNAKHPRKMAHRKVFEDLLMEPVLFREFTDEEKDNIRSQMHQPFCDAKWVAAAHDCSIEDACKVLSELEDKSE